MFLPRRARVIRSCAALLCTLLLGLSARAAAPAPASGTRGMVVTSESGATRAGLAMLERGGNAVDAAVAAAFALGVTQPFSAGVGGGAFLLIRRPDGELIALDARETAPAAAHRDLYLAPDLPERASLQGPLAVATPGFVAGCALALEKWGTVSLAEALQPAIALAEQGIEIGRYHARMLGYMSQRLRERFPETARIQLPPPDQPLRPGWRLVQQDLAETLRRLADRGPALFYTGELARAMAAHVQARGGILSAADLAAYRPRQREPVRGNYRGFDVVTFPPPSSGAVLLQMLHVLEAEDLAALGAGSSAALHRIAEAMKLGFADRNTYLGDPDFVDVPVERLISKEYAAAQRARLATPWWKSAPWHWGAERAARVRRPGLPLDDAGTAHLSTSDAAGGAVALTMTINTPFGSGITVPGTGVVLNNEMDDFATAPDTPNVYGLVDTRGANAIAPGKRPLSSMSPTIVEREGRLVMVTGSPGGPRIITSTLLTLIGVIDYGLDVSQAVSAPRFHHQWLPDKLLVEPTVAPDVVEALRRRGHHVEVSRREWSAVESIALDDEGVHWGAADPRRDGLAAGY